MKLQYKMVILFSAILLFSVGITGYNTNNQLQKTIETQMGNNAMDLAVTIASLKNIQKNLVNKDAETIQKQIETFREKTRFQYIIVMDMDGIKYSYPYEVSIGKKYLSGGEEDVLKYGKAYTSADRNRFISAIRAFVPIYYEGEQIGAVLVGLLNDTVNREIEPYTRNFQISLIIALVLGVIFTFVMTTNIKKTIFGQEPKEISLLLGEKELILESIDTGIIAINSNQEITLMNDLAKKIFRVDNAKEHDISMFDTYYTELLVSSMKQDETILHVDVKTKYNINLLCSFKPLKNHNNEIIGAVSTFQNKTEVKRMVEELGGMKHLTDNLRAQNHEFLNKLHIISGLIQLDEKEQAVKFIAELSHQRQEILGILTHNIKNVYVSGLLLAKYSKALELKIDFVVDKYSNMDMLPQDMSPDKFCSILGNLVENAIEELAGRTHSKIYIKLKQDAECIHIIVEDNGSGIDEDKQEKIFERGISSKKGQRGYGLWIIHNYIEEANGSIMLSSSEKGTTWEVKLPMK